MIMPNIDVNLEGIEGIEDCIRAGIPEKEISERVVDSCYEFSRYRDRYESTTEYREARETFLTKRLYALALRKLY